MASVVRRTDIPSADEYVSHSMAFKSILTFHTYYTQFLIAYSTGYLHAAHGSVEVCHLQAQVVAANIITS